MELKSIVRLDDFTMLIMILTLVVEVAAYQVRWKLRLLAHRHEMGQTFSAYY